MTAYELSELCTAIYSVSKQQEQSKEILKAIHNRLSDICVLMEKQMIHRNVEAMHIPNIFEEGESN